MTANECIDQDALVSSELVANGCEIKLFIGFELNGGLNFVDGVCR